jgi:hypothetical protein
MTHLFLRTYVMAVSFVNDELEDEDVTCLSNILCLDYH